MNDMHTIVHKMTRLGAKGSFVIVASACIFALGAVTIVHAQGPPSLSSSGGSHAGSLEDSNNSGTYFANTAYSSPATPTIGSDYYDTVNAAVDNGSNPSGITDFAHGNQNTTFGSSCGGCTSNTTFYSNGNGTYNTITTYTSSSGSSGSSSNSSNAASGASGSIPGGSSVSSTGPIPGTTYAAGVGTIPQSCTSGGKGSASVCTQAPVTSSPIANCTSGGKGSASVCSPSSCQLNNGQVLANGQSIILFDAPSGSCSATAHVCSNGTLTGSAGYQACSATAAAVQPDAPTSPITIKAMPAIVRYGGSSLISWDGGTAQSCSVSGPFFSAGGVSGSQLATAIPEERTYTLTCTFGGRNTAPVEKSTSISVKIVPLWREF
jgi:hypothetical protein